MVNHGYSHSEWNQYFGYIRSLAAKLPFMTIPGNHEDESPLYGRFHPQPGARYYYTFDYGSTRFFMIDSEREFFPGTKQYAWLSAQLAAAARNSRIRWRIAAFHTPAYSTGKHLSDAAAQKYLVPLFERYGINLVLNGHEHAYQITYPLRAGKRAANGIVYVVSGGAGATLYGFPVKADWIAFRDKLFHYGLYRVFPDRIEHVAKDAQGKEFHRTVIRK
jgi:3',5'-cyclic AMP phosphodiesterase CpdA